MTSFATLVRTHRRTARLTLAELADASGVSVRAIGDMERGRSTAQPRTLDALADALTLGAADRAALAAAAEAARSAPDVAAVLPRDVPDFTGRAAEIELLLTCLRDNRPALVHGPPGVGKTALAVRVATRFPGPLTFLDDVSEDTDLAGATLITSRRPLTGIAGLTRIPVGPLPSADSVRLLAAITGTAPGAAAMRVAELCDHLPLALRIAGNRLAGRPGWTMAHLADRLADEDRRLQVLSAGDLSVEAALAPSFAGLSEAARASCERADDAGRAELAEAGLILAADRRPPALLRIYARAQRRASRRSPDAPSAYGSS